ncbi:MAG: hypothetical protein AB1393_06660 [Candidatus Edwardsbacteria bacterium]
MQIKIFGKNTCPVCKQTKDKFEYFLKHWGYEGKIPLHYYNLDTVEGLAEGAYYEVSEIPTIVLEDQEKEITRWTKKPPVSTELKVYLEKEE